MAKVPKPGVTTDEIDRLVFLLFISFLTLNSVSLFRLLLFKLSIGTSNLLPFSSSLLSVAHDAYIERSCYPSTLNYRKFPKSLCTSINEVLSLPRLIFSLLLHLMPLRSFVTVFLIIVPLRMVTSLISTFLLSTAVSTVI